MRSQKILSRSVTKLRTAEVRTAMVVDESACALVFHKNHVAQCSAECGALYVAQPWMDDGHMRLGWTALLSLLSLLAWRYRLQPPLNIVLAGRRPCGKRIPHTAWDITEMDRLDHERARRAHQAHRCLPQGGRLHQRQARGPHVGRWPMGGACAA